MTEQSTTEKETPEVTEGQPTTLDKVVESNSFTIRDFLDEEDNSYLSINLDRENSFGTSIAITLHDGRGTAQLFYDLSLEDQPWAVTYQSFIRKLDSVIGALVALKVAVHKDLIEEEEKEEGEPNED